MTVVVEICGTARAPPTDVMAAKWSLCCVFLCCVVHVFGQDSATTGDVSARVDPALFGRGDMPKVVEDFKYLDNGAIRVGVGTKTGSIGFLAASNTPTSSVINIHDAGRYVQLSYYSGPQPYDGCVWSGQPWAWNPIGAGDAFGHSPQILSLSANASAIHVVTRPMQWACDNVPCDCTFEKTVWLDGNAVWVRATLNNIRQDKTDYGPHPQELPAAYTIGELSRLTCYTGDAPFTNQPLTVWDNTSGPPWSPGTINCTEHWAAFVRPSGSQFGMGVFRPSWPLFYTGFAGKHGTGGPTDPSTGYIAGNGCGHGVDLKWNSRVTYDFALVLGNVDDIRAYVAGKKAQLSDTCVEGQ